MNKDTIVFWLVLVIIAIWAGYQTGYEKGIDEMVKNCPPVSKKMNLHTITEYRNGIQCQYGN